ncbi:hypothetical protein FOZ76_20680 [Verticiella sediminum]|uniref:YfhO family protein n=1 Tax=Verticiella sediminum TaxID=1247510 RepID=A0A556ABK3_9BURK|nr:DUF6311 domain-containing protein [Verticiella sediminum]TSH90253.1 hypothetical protein FOZ76_20680 [Verticiella sediminum]
MQNPTVQPGAKPRGGYAVVLPWGIGLVAFLVIMGTRVLDPGNIAWLSSGDSSQHYLGWSFFRQTEWTFPIGLNPRYGLELSNAIVYSDSNPLLAFLFKPFAGWMGQDFQYFGFWLLACFLLQGWMAYRLIGLATGDPALRALGAVFFAFAPPMLIRMTDHLNLSGHFLLLGSLYLVFAPLVRRRRLAWGALLALGALVHAYLFIMVAALWGVDLLGRLLRRSLNLRAVLLEGVLLIGIVAVLAWQAGYFSVGGGGSTGGYGYYRANLISFVNPLGWSHVLRDQAQGGGDYEGAAYLGLGMLLLLVFGMARVAADPRGALAGAGRHWVAYLGLAGFFVFALSNNVGLGTHTWSYPIPGFFDKLAGYFRSSGRMLWVVYYAVFFAAIVLVVRGYPRRVALVLLGLALAVQLADTSAGWRPLRAHWGKTPGGDWNLPMRDPFWEAAATRYTRLRWAPPENAGPYWRELSAFADKHGMATDAIYLARVRYRALETQRADIARRVETGEYDPDTLYVLADGAFGAAVMLGDRERDLFARIDGLNVIAPGWKGCRDCPGLAHEADAQGSMPPLASGASLSFTEADNGGARYLGLGWSQREAWGTWSDGRHASLLLPLDRSAPRELLLDVQPLLGENLPAQRVQVRVDGAEVADFTVTARQTVSLAVPGAPQGGVRMTRVELTLPDAARPVDIGGGEDLRRLGLGLIGLTVR